MLKILKKMNLLLDRKQKRTMVGLIIMMLFGGVLESLGISMLVPIVTVVMDPVAVEESEILSTVYDMLGMESSVEFVLVSLSVCLKIWNSQGVRRCRFPVFPPPYRG